MKLLIAGSDEVWSLERYYIQHLSNLGVLIEICPVQSIFYKYYNRSLANKILHKIGLSYITRRIERQVKETIKRFKPDILWVFKGMELTPELLQWVKGQGIKLVNYNPDNPFLFSGRGSGNKNLTRSINIYDLHFTYDSSIRDRIEDEYKIACKMLPFGFELSDELYNECGNLQEVNKICFLGNPDNDRATFINELAKTYLIDVYGNHWEKFVQDKNITIYPAVYGKAFWETLSKYRVQLNLMRRHNPDSHNMRTFEVPGTGGILLAPATKDHYVFFEDNEEAFFYKDLQDAVHKANFLLHLSQEQAKGIRFSARNRSVNSGYSYRKRAEFVFKTFNELVNV